MPLILRPPGESLPLVEQLWSLGRTRRAARVAAGLMLVAAVVPLSVAVAAALDVRLRISAVPRGFMLVALLGAAVALFARVVRRPAHESADPLATAHLIESRYPQCNDAVASAVSFEQLEATGTAPGADRFRRVAVVQATNLTEKYEFEDVIPTGRLWQSFVALLLATAAVGVIIAGAGMDRMTFALSRLLDPFGDRPWPPDTRLRIVSPNKSPSLLARGDSFEVQFVVAGLVPSNATVEVQPVGGSAFSENVDLVGRGEVNATVKLDASRVGRDFEFRVRANDGETEWRGVRVLPPPRLVPLNGRPSPQVRLTFPAYTRQHPLPLPDGAGVIEAVSGTTAHLRAAADRRIVSAVLVNQSEQSYLPIAQAVAPLAGTNPVAVVGATLLADSYSLPIPVPTIDPDGRLLAVAFQPPLPGLYALRFTDEDGLTGVRLFDIRTTPDPSPTVSLDRPAVGIDPLTVLPTSRITLRGRAEDRLFACKTVAVEYRVGDGPPKHIPLADAALAGRAFAAVAGGGVGMPIPQPGSLEAGGVFPVASFTRPGGVPPADGDTITLRLISTDWDDRTVGKVPGRSNEVVLRILAPASFDALIQKELAGLRPELARQLENQKQLGAELTDLRRALPKDGSPTPDQRAKLADIERRQKQVQGKIGDPRDGERAKAERIRELVRGNDLPKTPVTDRAESVAKALGRADEQHLQNVTPPLTAARMGAETANPDAKAMTDALVQAERQQRGATDALTDAVQNLERWAGPGELRGDVRALKDQTAKAGAEATQAAERTPAGKSPASMDAADRAAATQAADKFDKAATEADALVAKAARVADEKAKHADVLKAAADAARAEADAAVGTPQAGEKSSAAAAAEQSAKQAAAEAAAIRQAAEQSGGDALPGDLRRAAEAARKNRPGEVAAAKQAADAKLDAMRDELTERPNGNDVDELRKKAKAAGDEIDKLADAQDELRKKSKEAATKSDAAERAEAFKQLADEQEKLERQAEQLARTLEQAGKDPAAEQLRRAAEQMDQSRRQLEQGQPPPANQQEETLDRLDEAREKLDQEKKDDQEQLDREKREELGKEFQALVEKQKAALAEADRVQSAALAAKKWDRPLQVSLSRLADREKELAEEVRSFSGTKLDSLKVFDRLARQAADQMDKAARRLNDRKDDALTADPSTFDAQTEAIAGETVRGPMAVALKRLQLIVDSIKADDKKPGAAQQGGGEGGSGGGEMGGGGMGGGIPPLAQLKALRDWQADVNERTAAFAKSHPDAAKLTDDEKDDLRDLERSQREIGELFEQLLPLFQKPDGGQP